MHALPVASVGEVATVYWFDSFTAPTVRAVVEHARLVLDADLSFPVILGPRRAGHGRMHRIARALLEGKAEVSAVRCPALPEPDYRGCQLSELPYLPASQAG